LKPSSFESLIEKSIVLEDVIMSPLGALLDAEQVASLALFACESEGAYSGSEAASRSAKSDRQLAQCEIQLFRKNFPELLAFADYISALLERRDRKTLLAVLQRLEDGHNSFGAEKLVDEAMEKLYGAEVRDIHL
jgi:hypothetical protein